MTTKYQVFVSSTYLDLLEERQQVMYSLLALDCIPSGMELFPAADMAQWDLIKQVIDECDYYLLIMGGRYGSIMPRSKKSYTQMEYEYAIRQKKPVVAFLHSNPKSLPEPRRENTKQGEESLGEFRKLVQKRLCKFWTSPDELSGKVTASLHQLMKTSPAAGWVRGDPTGVFYDELDELENQLGGLELTEFGLKKTLFDIVERYALETTERDWNSESVADYIYDKFDNRNGETTNSAFWYLTIFGFLTFNDINDWDEEVWWKNAVEYSIVPPRGKALLRKIQRREGIGK